MGFTLSHVLHVWNIYLHDWAIFGVNVGQYSIHEAFGYIGKWSVYRFIDHLDVGQNGRPRGPQM